MSTLIERVPGILMRCVLAIVALCCFAGVSFADTILVPAGSVWKYLDDGSNQGTSWRGASFNDGAWKSGPAQLGYGDGDEAMVVEDNPTAGYNSADTNRFITTYFRKAFTVADKSAFGALKLRTVRDDGVVVYLNGTEIWRNNLPTGTISSTTLASTAIGGTSESAFNEAVVGLGALVAGDNVLAVEIHQSAANSSDISFDLELSGVPPGFVRKPYLQVGTPNSVTIRWRTNVSTETVLRYGTTPPTPMPGDLDSNAMEIVDATPKTEHEVRLTNLTPDTRYYYCVGSSSATFASGGDYVFYTAPPAGTPYPTRVWVIGDAGTGTADQAAVRDAYYNLAGGSYTDVMLMLGDNVYDTGTDSEYTTKHFGMYDSILRQTVTWPAVGNHDTSNYSSNPNNPPLTIPYFQSFTMPTNGEAGGVPSGTEKYYSFDYGEIHFICLDSMTSLTTNSEPNQAMLTWLEQDLASTTQKWVIAYWHHPPYSKGHDSDTDAIEIGMRTKVVPLLESYGVDLLLFGHSHAYERSYLLDGHYGLSSTFDKATMTKDASSGSDPNGTTGGYNKPTLAGAGREGAVYAVAGNSGKTQDYPGITDNGSGNGVGHPAMFISWERVGSLVLDVDGNRLDARFLGRDKSTGQFGILDQFTITRGPRTNAAPSVAIAAPATGSQFNDGRSITVTATANDSDQGIQEVVFYANSSRIGKSTAGTANSYSVTWTPPGVGNYTIEARAVDQLGKSSFSAPVEISVSSTPTPDTTAPGAIYDLAGTASTANSVSLSWTAPGDDGSTGTATLYDVRFSTVPITDANWSDAAVVFPAEGEPIPVAAGTVQTLTVDGLAPDTTYYFALKTQDEVGNESVLSNVANRATAGNPPAAPSSLAAAAASSGLINLTWADNSDDEQGFRIERSLDAKNFTEISGTLANVTSYADSYVTPATTYYYRVIAFKSGGLVSAPSNIASATTPPAAPGNLTADATARQVTLTWTPSAGAASYTVRRGQEGPDGLMVFTVIASGITDSQYTDGTVSPQTYYLYRVTAVAVGESAPAEVGVVTPALMPPNAPGGLTAVAVSTSQIDLSWADNSTNESGFRIERSVDGGASFTTAGTVAANLTAYSDTGLTAGTTYVYRVVAYNADGASAPSGTATATTMIDPPAAPGSLTATAGDGTVALNWAASAGATSYSVKRSTISGGPYSTIASGLTATNYTDNAVTNGTTYYYILVALNAGGESAGSNQASATPVAPVVIPNAPTGLTAVAVSKSQIDLTWSDNSTNEDGFIIEQSSNNRSFNEAGRVGPNATTFRASGFGANKTMYFRIRAFNQAGSSAPSNTASATTLRR